MLFSYTALNVSFDIITDKMLNKSLTSIHGPSVNQIVSRRNPKIVVMELGTNGYGNNNMLHEVYDIDMISISLNILCKRS